MRTGLFQERMGAHRGYGQVAPACAAVEVPPERLPEDERARLGVLAGYAQVDQACVAIEIPENAYQVDAYGRGWQCGIAATRSANGAARRRRGTSQRLPGFQGTGLEVQSRLSQNQPVLRGGRGAFETAIPKASETRFDCERRFRQSG